MPWADSSTVGHWQYRARAAASWIPLNSTVLDLGCGDMTLERELHGCHYYSSDIVARDHRTIVCDLNKEYLPKLEVTHVAVLGVLEHLVHHQHFVKELERFTCPVIISYHFDRWDKRWLKRLTRSEFEHLFEHYKITQRQTISPGQELMYMELRKP